MESLGILLNLLEHFAVGRQAGMGLVEQEKMIVPFAEGFLGSLVAACEGGGGFGSVDARLCKVACRLGGFAQSV